ncbi:MAG TPA: methyltransferase domain-containing protein [Pyrinomonadaceae bacterium]|nr:methyltransferase domain-containing protein [Pyrinomonadaceae bacterium]
MALSNDELRRRLAGQEWTAHNLRINSEIATMPGKPDFMETDLRLKAIMRALAFCYRGQLAGLRLADLGCLEGGFTLAMAQQGMEVIGLEARQMNLDKCLLLKDQFDLPELEFRLDDVKNFGREKYGVFDVVLALGIFYHLNHPITWLQQAAAATRGLMVIESHYAPADDRALKQLDSRLKLGPLVQESIDGFRYEGRWFFEFEPHADREVMPWASYSNNQSFWLTKESLLRATLRSGFDLVFEQHDYSAESYQFHNFVHSRGLFLAIKSNGVRDVRP